MKLSMPVAPCLGMIASRLSSQPALLSPFQAPARVLDLVLTGEIDVATDDRILAEYREVLARPKFTFHVGAVQDLLDYFEHTGVVTTAPPLTVMLPDPDDSIFIEVAAATHAALITGNLRHYPPEQCHMVRIFSPAAFLEDWQLR
ncbi:PIN domain-containing protein [Caldilinea sp.]|uniref:PIN domain-containing protein n=1 Tax=Caldilinea sp. TaxID=2293560 RepID=UPI002BFD812C|nr:PIN domain-containing protein [Caldilinea sp.]